MRKDWLHGDPEWIEDFHDKFVLDSGGDDDQSPDISVKIDKFSRPVLKFRIRPKTDSRLISVYVVHFKSKRPTDIYREGWYKADTDFYKKHKPGLGAAISTIRRSAEAAALRMLISEELKNTDTPVVVLGDMNDAQLSNHLKHPDGTAQLFAKSVF